MRQMWGSMAAGTAGDPGLSGHCLLLAPGLQSRKILQPGGGGRQLHTQTDSLVNKPA